MLTIFFHCMVIVKAFDELFRVTGFRLMSLAVLRAASGHRIMIVMLQFHTVGDLRLLYRDDSRKMTYTLFETLEPTEF